MKTFLLIEPSVSPLLLIFKAIKNDKLFIISKYTNHFTSMKDNFNLSHKVAHQLLSLYKKQFLNVESLFFNKNILLLTLKAAGYAILTYKN